MKMTSLFSHHRSILALSKLTVLATAISLGLSAPARGDVSRVLPDGQVPQDRRLNEQKDLNGYFPFSVPDSPEAWEKRAAELRRRVQVATGTWPLPERTPLNSVIHGRIEQDGFTIEKVYFESVPNHFVTGLLFRPAGKGDGNAGRPAVLCPHGHGGRLQDYGAAKMKGLIESGAEKFEQGNRFPKLSRCVQLARIGCVAFIYDMIGYADSVQLSYELAHRFAKQRPEFESRESWGLFSTQAELRLQSIMGLQSWNSIRALDFLSGLPDVDPRRIAVTGGSGGGTQTILLCAVDPRPVAAFPQGMVSTSMQGGCTCENCSLLRIGTGNVELCALFAPKPQGMTTANDWTKEMMTKGFPELKQLYTMLGVADHIMCKPLNHFPHNYNYVTRHLMYDLFNKHLKFGLDQPVKERDWRLLTAAEATVWDDKHPRPEGGPQYERALTKWMADQSDRQIAALMPEDEPSLAEYREVVGGAVETMIGRAMPMVGSIEREKIAKEELGGFLYFKDILRNVNQGEVLPIISFYPTARPWNNHVVIWLDGRGKRGVFDSADRPNPPVRQLLARGASVVSADLLYQGEFLAAEQTFDAMPVVKNPREFAGYTFGYNHTVFARRVHDVLSLISWIRNDDHAPAHVHLVGVNGAGPIVAAARAIAGKAVDRAAVDTKGFRFANLRSYRDANFIPGAVKYGDLPALLALSAPHKLLIAGEQGATPTAVSAAYQAAGKPGNVNSVKGNGDENAMHAANWLLK
ncbi:MAG TPA: acetylxylan esterase [Pirellulaceae bacterium]|nr:acetylxylan esterase [Pirellulaceae bacterium]